MKRPRQFIVTHTATGQQTVVVGLQYQGCDGTWTHSFPDISIKAGHRAPADSTVTIVPYGQEYRLPFDTLPLIIRRADAKESRSAA